jgi:hypothetical protein
VDRCALFVDAGYLLADGAMAVHGTRNRESVTWDYAGALAFLANLARDRTGLPLLRCYWYEATVEGRRTPEHDVLADLPGVKLRLGRMRPGRREGVESEIHRDLATLARNGAITDALVISAEEDLSQAIADVQDLGLRVIIVHVTVDGSWTISRTLRQECDDIVEISEAHLRPYVELVVGAEPAGELERQPAAAYTGRAPANGHSALGAFGHQPALPAGSHQSPPAIYTAPAIAEYHRSAQPGLNGQPPPMHSSGQIGASSRSSGPAGPPIHSSGPVGPPIPAQQASSAQQAAPAQHGGSEQSAGAAQPAGVAQPAEAAQPAEVAQSPRPGGTLGAAGGHPAHAAPSTPGQHAASAAGLHAAATTVPGLHAAHAATSAAMPGQPPMGQHAQQAPAPPQPGMSGTQAGMSGPQAGMAGAQAGVSGAQAGMAGAQPGDPAAAIAGTQAIPEGASAEPSAVQPPGAQPPPLSPVQPNRPVYQPSPVPPAQQTPSQHAPGQPPPGQQPPGQPPPGQQPLHAPGQPGPAQHVSAQPGQHAAAPGQAGQPAAAPAGAGQPAPAPAGFRGQPHEVPPHVPSGARPHAPETQGPGPQHSSGPIPVGSVAGQTAQQSRGAARPYPPPATGVPGLGAPSGPPPGRMPGGPGDQRPAHQFGGPPPGHAYVPPQGPPTAPQAAQHGTPVPSGQHGSPVPPVAVSLADAVQAAHNEGFNFGQAVARDAPALWLEAVLARKPRMPSDLEARLLQDSALPIDSLLHDEVRHALRRGFWDALERTRH